MKETKEIILREDFLAETFFVLSETFEGSPEGQGSAYLDHGIGVLPTLDNLTAEAASSEINLTTIAAQTEHLRFYLDRICEFLNGRTEKVDWSESWRIKKVSDSQWNNLRQEMRNSYENVKKCLTEIPVWNQDNIGDSITIIAHTAYHLGSIRQIAKTLNQLN